MFEVSVIIPVYNAAKYIEQAVKSALEQEEVVEIILVEDASSDNSLAICIDIQSRFKKIKLVQHHDKKNHGAGASRNLGIRNAASEFIAFLDADDQYLPGRFSAEKNIFLSEASIEGVYNACIPVALDDEGQSRLGNASPSLLTMNKPYPPEQLFENISPVGESGFFFLNTLTVKKEVFNKTGLMNPLLRLSQDTDITIKLAALCKIVPGNLTAPVALYAIHSNNRSNNKDQLTANRPNLFYNLYIWGRNKQLPKCRVFLLWERYYHFNLLVNKPSRNQQLLLLCREGLKNTDLFSSRFFLRQLPLLNRLIS